MQGHITLIAFSNDDSLIEKDRQCLQYSKPVIDAKRYIRYGVVTHEVERQLRRYPLGYKVPRTCNGV